MISKAYLALAAICLAIGVGLWYALLHELITGTNPVGILSNHHDFLAFYTAAKLMLAGQVAHLYDGNFFQAAQYGISHQRVGAAGYMPFMNPPFTAAAITGLGVVSEPIARSGWLIANTALALVVCYCSAKTLPLNPKQRLLTTALLMSTFPLYESLVEGQVSVVMLAGCGLALMFANRNQLYLSGAFLAVLWLKPQLALLALGVLVVFRCWKIAGSLVATGAALAALASPLTGLAVYGSYWHYLTAVLQDHLDGAGAVTSSIWKGRLELTAGINGLFTAIFGQSAIRRVDGFTALFDTILVAFYLAVIKTVSWHPPKAVRYTVAAISVGLIMLINPHLYQQDVIFIYLLLPLLISRMRQPLFGVVVLVFATDLLMLDYMVPLHLFTVALFGLTLGLCWQIITTSRRHRAQSAQADGDARPRTLRPAQR